MNVDIQKTKELYKELPLISEKEHCGCSNCAYYKKQLFIKLQQFNSFLNSLALTQGLTLTLRILGLIDKVSSPRISNTFQQHVEAIHPRWVNEIELTTALPEYAR